MRVCVFERDGGVMGLCEREMGGASGRCSRMERYIETVRESYRMI